VLGHDHAGPVGGRVPAGRGGAHQEEAGADHGVVLLHHRRAGGRARVAETFLVIEVQGGANTAESSSLAPPLLLDQAPRAHHARDGRSLREFPTSPVLAKTVRLPLHLLKRRSTETVSHVLEAEPVSLPRVREGGRSGGEVLESGGEVLEGEGGGAGRFEGGGGHAAQGEAQCPRDRQQQHHLIQLSGPGGWSQWE